MIRTSKQLLWGVFVVSLVAMLACLSIVANAEELVALVIGNGAYRSVPALPNPPNDAADIAASLERLGFSVQRLTDARYNGMRRALLDFNRRARSAHMAVVFYAGHGMEVGGENWLIPIDAELKTDTDTEHEAISLKTVMSTVDGASKLGLVILDACRNNPFTVTMQRTVRMRAVARGLVRIEPTGNVLVAYSAKDGTTAAEGSTRNSPFSAALLRHLETPGLEINFLFRRVRDDVMVATRNEQQPFTYGSLSQEEIYLKAATSAFTSTPGGPLSSAPPIKNLPGPVAVLPPKITDRIEQPSISSTKPVAAVPQRVVLYEENPADAQGKRYLGSVIWRTEMVSPAGAKSPEVAVGADLEIPERRITMTMSIRRNTDQAFPASHTVEIVFNLPADFPFGGISNVPGILMKQAEQTRGAPLAGLAVKVTSGSFLVGLSAVDSEMQRNLDLLRERGWFDIPIVYNNGRRAILAIEKGASGERIFTKAFATWRDNDVPANDVRKASPADARSAAPYPPSVVWPNPSMQVVLPPAPAAGYLVQLFVGTSEVEVQDQFRELQAKYLSVLGGRQPIFRRANLGDRVAHSGDKAMLYRTMVGPFTTNELANQFCDKLKAAGGKCLVQRN
jgi:hypothetical protein